MLLKRDKTYEAYEMIKEQAAAGARLAEAQRLREAAEAELQQARGRGGTFPTLSVASRSEEVQF